MKLKYKFEIVELEDESIAVPVGNNANFLQGVLKLNQEGAEILRLLDDFSDEEGIVDALAQKYDNDRFTLSMYVHKILQEFIEKGILE